MATSAIDRLEALLSGAAPGIALSNEVAAYDIEGKTPRLAVHPATASDVAAVLAAAKEAGAAVVPWGGGAYMHLGAAPQRYDLALDLRRLNNVIEYAAADLTVSVEAGMRLVDLQETLAAKGRWLPLDPPVSGEATIGGILAANASGPGRVAYGSARDLVIGMQVALPNGDLVKSGGRVVKNVAGYDLAKLHIGGLGTLGIIVQAAFKISPLPVKTLSLRVTGAAPAPLMALAVYVRDRGLAANGIALCRPPAGRDWQLLVRFAGGSAAVERSRDELVGKAAEAGLVVDDAAGAWDEMPSFQAAVRLKASLPPAAGVAVLEAMATEGASITAYPTVGIIYAGFEAIEARDVEALRQRCEKQRGALVVEAAPAALKQAIDVWGAPRGDIGLMRRLKQEFDPAGVLNPGRYVGGHMTAVSRKIDPADLLVGPQEEDLARCVHCGFCHQACPTYLILGNEADSPRGRIQLAKALVEGRIEPTPAVAAHFDLCLACRACETACPSGVPYGRIIEGARAMVQTLPERPKSWWLRSTLLRLAFAQRWRLRFAFGALRLYQQTPLAGLARRVLPKRLRQMEQMLPRLPRRSFDPKKAMVPPMGEQKATVVMLDGCVMPIAYPQTNEATVRVLARNGCKVEIPEQRCCGALHLHNGDPEAARDLAKRNIDSFLAMQPDAIIVNSAGCGSTMKEYGELFAHDKAYAEKAERFSALVKDVSEFLAALPLDPPKASLDVKVTYQDSCHLAHGQRVREAPRRVLRAIPGVQIREMATPDRCCGSAGIYNITQTGMSRQVLAAKMEDVATTGCDLITTANPGCMLQLELGVRLQDGSEEVLHVVELLDRAYQAEAR